MPSLRTHCWFVGRQAAQVWRRASCRTSKTCPLSRLNSDSFQPPEMKLNVFVSAVALLGAFRPPYECRAIESPGAGRSSSSLPKDLQQLSLPILLRLGEEYFIRLDDAKQDSPATSPSDLSAGAPATTVNRALQLQLTQLLQGKAGNLSRFLSSYGNQMEDLDPAETGKRSADPPISLDLTFHLLREVLEMARAEQVAQQANRNRKMMDIFGK